MTKNEILEKLKELKPFLANEFSVKEIGLFGSFSNNEQNEESDIDIAVILKEFENPMEIQLELMRLRRKIDGRIEPHPFREKDFNITNPVVNEILKHGQRIDAGDI